MPEKIEQRVELTAGQWDWLGEIAQKHGLPDEGKVLRCLVNHAREAPELEDDIFAEIRCADC